MYIDNIIVPDEDRLNLMRDAHLVEVKNRVLRKQIYRATEIFRSLYLLHRECWHEIRKFFERQQKRTFGDGMNGTLLFDLASFEAAVNQGHKGFFLTAFEKHGLDSAPIVYDTLKRLDQDKIATQKKKAMKFSVTLQDFLAFSPVQVISLISFVPQGLNRPSLEWDAKSNQCQTIQKKLRRIMNPVASMSSHPSTNVTLLNKSSSRYSIGGLSPSIIHSLIMT
jgi:hypothetical protein